MSGYKHATVTISQDEYRRLQEADKRKLFKEYSHIKSENPGQNEVVLALIHELEERERQLQAALSSLSHSSDSSETILLQQLLNQNSDSYERLIENLRISSNETQGAMLEIRTDFFTMMNTEHEAINHTLQSLIAEQSDFQDNEFFKADTAQQWLCGCLTLADFVQTQFDHERFTPGRLNRILRMLNLAEDNLANGFHESSLQASQQMYLELTDLIFELEQYVMLWQTAFEKAYSELNETIFQMVSNGKVQAVGLNGEFLPEFIDVNFWTNGRFLQLVEHARQLSRDLIQDKSILTMEDLERIDKHILPAIRGSFESSIMDARLNALNSQLRMNIAEKALEALENHGYFLDRSGYQNNDMRTQFNAHLACPDGSEVEINVLPNDRSIQELSNDLVVITTHPDMKTEHEARLQWEELSETLRQYNLNVSRPEIRTVRSLNNTTTNREMTQVEQHNAQVER